MLTNMWENRRKRLTCVYDAREKLAGLIEVSGGIATRQRAKTMPDENRKTATGADRAAHYTRTYAGRKWERRERSRTNWQGTAELSGHRKENR